MKRILFQGDSITFAWRDYDNPTDMGQGYPNLIAGRLGLQYPDKYEFINRGVNGSRIVSIYSRIRKDIINLKPDWISILIGVNDAWLEYLEGIGVETERYKKIYSMLIEDVLEELPDTGFILLEPFVLKGTVTHDIYKPLREQVLSRAEAVREIAEEYRMPFIPLQNELDNMAKQVSAEYYLYDGVHPSMVFHQFIADKWLDTFQKFENNDFYQ